MSYASKKRKPYKKKKKRLQESAVVEFLSDQENIKKLYIHSYFFKYYSISHQTKRSFNKTVLPELHFVVHLPLKPDASFNPKHLNC